MDELNLNNDSVVTEPVTDPGTQPEKPPTTAIHRRSGIVIAVVLSLFLLASVSYAFWQRSNPKQSTPTLQENTQEMEQQLDTQTQSQMQSDLLSATTSPTFAPVAAKGTATPTPTVKPTSTPTTSPTATPTPTPVPVDVAITAVYLWDYNAMSSIQNPTASNTLSIDEKNWTSIPSPISMNFELKTVGNTTQNRVPFRVSANNTVIQSGLIGVVNASGTMSQTFSLPKDPGNYTVVIEINQPSEYTDSNSNNNRYTFPYTIRVDTTPPQISFDILKRAETQQTCVTPRYATDVSTGENDIRFEGKLDNENWYSFPYRPDPSKEARYERCLTGTAGEYHTFSVKAWDKRGNQTEGVYSFSLYAF